MRHERTERTVKIVTGLFAYGTECLIVVNTMKLGDLATEIALKSQQVAWFEKPFATKDIRFG